MTDLDAKGDLHRYLQGARETLVWKLDGLDEYDARRPLTPSGTNLLGLVKHNASTHIRYLGDVFGRPVDPSLSWMLGGDDPNGEFWAAPDQGRDEILDGHRLVCDHADATIAALPLDAVGRVPWWGDRPVTLLGVLVHVTAESQRHAGHADIIRELIDGAAGLLEGFDNLRIGEPTGRSDFHDRVEAGARLAGGR